MFYARKWTLWVLYSDISISYFYKLSASQRLPKPTFLCEVQFFFFGLAAGPTYQPLVRHSNPDTPWRYGLRLNLPVMSVFFTAVPVIRYAALPSIISGATSADTAARSRCAAIRDHMTASQPDSQTDFLRYRLSAVSDRWQWAWDFDTSTTSSHLVYKVTNCGRVLVSHA